MKIILYLGIVVLILIVIQGVRILDAMHHADTSAVPFQKLNPKASYKVLFAGDSTCVGTGAEDNSKSTAGWFSQYYPHASIENHSQNGLRLKGLADILLTLKEKHYDLAVLQIGANDIIHLTPLTEIEKNQRQICWLAKQLADKVIILHSGDVGKAPLFIWPFNKIYSWRTRKVREIYQKSQDEQISYVDIYELEKTVKNPNQNYAPDHLHLNSHGYYLWFTFIRSKLFTASR